MNDVRQRRPSERLGFSVRPDTLGIAFYPVLPTDSACGVAETSVTETSTDSFSYTAKVNSFMPASSDSVPRLECHHCGVGSWYFLVAGMWLRWTALASALLLILFGTAMAISFGLKSPLDYSVFSASAAAILVALNERGTSRMQSSA